MSWADSSRRKVLGSWQSCWGSVARLALLPDKLGDQRKDAADHQGQKHDGLTGKVLAYLELLNGGYPAADAVAKVMGMTGRSFRRQLSVEQTSFRQLLDRARYQKACSYLKDSSQSIDQLAQLLGYSEAASFIHAFQRWSGMSPSVFRKHQGFLGVERQ